jgi:hypothetical protein
MSGAVKTRAQLLRDWVDFRERFSEHVGGYAIYDVVPYAVLESGVFSVGGCQADALDAPQEEWELVWPLLGHPLTLALISR